MMTHAIKTLTCVSALALALPAAAQQADEVDAPGAATWQELTTPSVRFIQRGSDGSVLFDSGAAPGASDPELADKIAEADGETIGATDVREMSGDEMVSLRRGAPSPDRAPGPLTGPGGDVGAIGTVAQDEAGDLPGPVNGDESLMAAIDDMPAPETDGRGGEQDVMAAVDDVAAPRTDGQYGSVTTASGMEFDMEEFAREMFEQGYRRGYVSGLTEMRTRAVRQMQGERAQFAQYRQRMEEQAREQRRAMNEVLDREPAPTQRPQMQRRGDGTTVIMLPPGMTPQEFMRSLNR